MTQTAHHISVSGEANESRWRPDVVAGFQVFLIALPLSLGIAMASGFPAVAGVLTAIVGGVVSTWLGSARLTIKGPAAGLIVIALGAVTELGHGDAMRGYHLALACIVGAGGLQVVFALVGAGKLGDFFPKSVVHGMLAAIGVIIFAKQSHVLLGVRPSAREPLLLLREIPHSLRALNPEIAIIGALSVAVLVLHPKLKGRADLLWRVPAPFLVLLLSVPLGLFFDLEHVHTYSLAMTHGHYQVGPTALVNLPAHLYSAVTLPDFSQITSPVSLRYIAMFALVGSIESLLSAKAVDILDPQKRRSDLNRDLLATGVGNILAGCIGGLPMISEIVRSSANIGYGAQSRRANFAHGVFLLGFVALVPGLIHRVPLAALAAMLVVTGVRLASPGEIVHTYKIGWEQLLLFLTTMVVTLASDLLIGVGAGIVLKLVLHIVRGVTPGMLFRTQIDVTDEAGAVRMTVRGAAVFTNYLGLASRLRAQNAERIILDLSNTRMVDHTVMRNLQLLVEAYARDGRSLEIRGLDDHAPTASHPLASRTRGSIVVREATP